MANDKAIIIGPWKYSRNGCIPIVASDDTGDRGPISFIGDIFQVVISIITVFFLHIRLTRGCILDVVVVMCSRWFMVV